MARRAEVTLSDQERAVLARWARRPKRSQALAMRCRIVLAAAAGESSKDIAARLGCRANTVGKWRPRFARRGCDGLHDEPRPGKPRSIGDEDIEQGDRQDARGVPARRILMRFMSFPSFVRVV